MCASTRVAIHSREIVFIPGSFLQVKTSRTALCKGCLLRGFLPPNLSSCDPSWVRLTLGQLPDSYKQQTAALSPMRKLRARILLAPSRLGEPLPRGFMYSVPLALVPEQCCPCSLLLTIHLSQRAERGSVSVPPTCVCVCVYMCRRRPKGLWMLLFWSQKPGAVVHLVF